MSELPGINLAMQTDGSGGAYAYVEEAFGPFAGFIEGILMIWVGSAAHPMMWSAPGLTEKLSALSGAVLSGDTEPTESMYAVFADISERFEFQRSRFDSSCHSW